MRPTPLPTVPVSELPPSFSLDAERARLSEGLRQAGDQPTSEQITELWETVRRLHWILQGHFGDEEDDLFLPAEELISPESLAEADRSNPML